MEVKSSSWTCWDFDLVFYNITIMRWDIVCHTSFDFIGWIHISLVVLLNVIGSSGFNIISSFNIWLIGSCFMADFVGPVYWYLWFSLSGSNSMILLWSLCLALWFGFYLCSWYMVPYQVKQIFLLVEACVWDGSVFSFVNYWFWGYLCLCNVLCIK